VLKVTKREELREQTRTNLVFGRIITDMDARNYSGVSFLHLFSGKIIQRNAV
jgi:hypothetical protein